MFSFVALFMFLDVMAVMGANIAKHLSITAGAEMWFLVLSGNVTRAPYPSQSVSFASERLS